MKGFIYDNSHFTYNAITECFWNDDIGKKDVSYYYFKSYAVPSNVIWD